MLYLTVFKRFLLLFLCAFITSCGGGDGGDDTNKTVTLPSEEVSNTLPVYNSSAELSFYETQTINFTIDASDADGDPLIISANNYPAWLDYDVSTLTLSGSPGLDDQGIYTVNIEIDDGGQSLVTTSLVITIQDTISIEGQVIDGYISGALVYIDENNNNEFDSNEFSSITNVNGAYSLIFPKTREAELINSPLRAYIGAGAEDMSRPELDFSKTPITLSIPPIIVSDIENNQVQDLVLSPFTEQIYQLVVDDIASVKNGHLSIEQLKVNIRDARKEIVNEVLLSDDIDLNDVGLSESEVEDIIFGDFIIRKDSLPSIVEQGRKYIDLIIASDNASDFDGDGVLNEVDLDDDNDGTPDFSDRFPFNSSEWRDYDNDGVGDNSDFYPYDTNCNRETDGNGAVCYTSWLTDQNIISSASSTNGLLFVLTEKNSLLTFDAKSNHVLNVQALESAAQLIYHEAHGRLYLASLVGEVSYLNEDYEVVSFIETCADQLVEAGDFLVVRCQEAQNDLSSLASYSLYGELIDTYQSALSITSSLSWDNITRRLYSYVKSVYFSTLSQDGFFGEEVKQSPSILRDEGVIYPSQDGRYFLTHHGAVYAADKFPSDNTYESTDWFFGFDFNQAHWLPNGGVLLLAQGYSSVFLQYSTFALNEASEAEFALVESSSIEGELISSQVDGNNVFITVLTDRGLISQYYIPNDDLDGDGVVNTLDSFPNDAAASVDSDNDRYPDRWNDGASESDSISGLVLDSFPSDKTCWLEEHSLMGDCDTNRTILYSPDDGELLAGTSIPIDLPTDEIPPYYSSDDIIAADDGNLYFFNRTKAKIYPWSAESKAFTAAQDFSIPIDDGVIYSNLYTETAYSNSNNRLYIGYPSCVITYFDMEVSTQELDFTTDNEVCGELATLGDYLLVQNTGAENSHFLFSSDGELLDNKDRSYYSFTDYEWDEHSSRMFFLTTNYFGYEEIDQDTGTITDRGDIVKFSSEEMVSPFKITDDGYLVVLGSGYAYDADTLDLKTKYNVHEQASDIITTENFIVIGEEYDGAYHLLIIDVADTQSSTYGLEVGTITLDYIPLKITRNGNNLNLVRVVGDKTILADSHIFVEVMELDDTDEDGLPQWWEELYGLSDSNTLDGALDSDNDGLTNLEEYTSRSNPMINDSDADGISDGEEVKTYQSNPIVRDSDGDSLIDGKEVNYYLSSPTNADSDNDGINDGDEVLLYFSDPLNEDSDSDGMLDFFELENKLNLIVDDAQDDADSDGLVNIDEMTLYTDVNIADTDRDGLDDGDEVHTYLTQPLHRDSDGDKMVDGWEALYTLNPLDSSDAALDFDSDSYSNKVEYFVNSSPVDAHSIPVPNAWNSFQGNADNAGFVAINIAPENLTYIWTSTLPNADLGTTYEKGVVAADGKVLTVYEDDFNKENMVALSATSGGIDWKKEYEGFFNISPPSFSEDTLFFQAGNRENSFVYSLNINDGSEVFLSLLESGYRHNGITLFDNEMYAGGGSGADSSYMLNAETGEKIWSQDSGYCNDFVPAVNDEHLFYFKSGLKVVNKSNGDVEMIGESIESHADCDVVALGKHNALVTSTGGLFAFDMYTAETVWQDDYNFYSDTPAVALGNVYALKNGALRVYDEDSGEELWTWGSGLSSNIALSLNLLFVGDRQYTYAIDLNTHEQVWSYPATGNISLSLEGALYIQSANASIVAIDFGIDSDQDGIADWWEKSYGLDSSAPDDAIEDADNDGLTNLEEFTYSTNPLEVDSDEDGLSDADEIKSYLSDPLSTDTDDDGMPDSWEVEQGFNLVDSTDASLDADNDSISNLAEYTHESDPNDDLSVPDTVSLFNFTFEDDVFSDVLNIDVDFPSLWEINNTESYEGSNSLMAPIGGAAFEFSGYFPGSRLAFSSKTSAYSWIDLTVYIDDASYSIYVDREWRENEILIEEGAHIIRFESYDLSETYIDNFSLSSLGNLLESDTWFVATESNKLNFYNKAGDVLEEIGVPLADDYSDPRDLSVLDDGRIAIFNGTFEPKLSIYSPEQHLWEHIVYDEWSSWNGHSTGGIATIDNVVYVTNMNSAYNDSQGIIKFDLTVNTIESIYGKDYIDLTMGLDGFLYAITGLIVDKYNPVTMELLSSFTTSEIKSIAVDSDGDIYSTSWSGDITHYNSSGVVVKRINVESSSSLDYISPYLSDINLNSEGQLVITNINGAILLSDTTLSDLSYFIDSESFKGRFLGLLP